MMRIDRNLAPQPRETYARAAAAEQSNTSKSNPTTGADTVTISEEGRQASIAAQMEAAGIDPALAEKLASGKIQIVEPDWDTFEIPTLVVNPDPKLFETTFLQTVTSEKEALETQVRDYYAPMLAELEGMDRDEAIHYLYRTYVQSWLGDFAVNGTELPDPPEGMTKQSAAMAYDQLRSLYLTGKLHTTEDPYALGEEGMNRLENIYEFAKETAQAACDKAQQELDAQAKQYAAEQKEKFRDWIAKVNSGELTGTCMGFMTLG